MGARVGVLFICMNVDYRVLFQPLTDETIRDGMEFYTTFFFAPPAIKVSSYSAIVPIRRAHAVPHRTPLY